MATTTLNSVKAMYLEDGYRPSRGLTGWYRYLTVGEAKRLSFSTVYAIDKWGTVRECRLNGAPKTWKTRPGCKLSLKYGLREHFRVGSDEAQEHERLSQYGQVHIVVPVKQQFDVDMPADVVSDWVLEHEVK